MSRYYPSRTAQTADASWKSPLVLAAVSAGVLVVGMMLVSELTAQRVIHVRADDSSDSAASYAAVKQAHCQASVQHYKPGDTAIAFSFADRPVTTQNISIANSLTLLGACKNSQPPMSKKQPGTSLILLLERIQSVVQKQRARHNLNPLVVTITIQDAEPGPNQPQLDLDKVKELVNDIIADGGSLALMVEDEDLQSQLDMKLAEDGNVEVCSFQDVNQCVNLAFEMGRERE